MQWQVKLKTRQTTGQSQDETKNKQIDRTAQMSHHGVGKVWASSVPHAAPAISNPVNCYRPESTENKTPAMPRYTLESTEQKAHSELVQEV